MTARRERRRERHAWSTALHLLGTGRSATPVLRRYHRRHRWIGGAR
jgi:hypothetical protein